jgi:hypothetical protein
VTHLPGLAGTGRPPVYQLTVTTDDGYSGTVTCDTFEDLSEAIDAALALPGLVRYEVGPAGDR